MVQTHPRRSSSVANGPSLSSSATSSSSSSCLNINLVGRGRRAPPNSPSSSLENGFQFLRLNSNLSNQHHMGSGQNAPSGSNVAQFPFHQHQPNSHLVVPAPRKVNTKKLAPLDTNLLVLNPSRKSLSRGPVTPTGTETSTAFSSLLQPIFKSATGGTPYSSCPSPSSPRLYFSRNGMGGGGCNSPLPFAMDEDLTETGVSAEECLQSACQELMEILGAPAPMSPPISSSMNIDRPIHHVV